MEELLKDTRFNFVTASDKQFIIAFTQALQELGYDYDSEIGSGYCWGKYMILYRKQQVKSDKVYARIYMRENGIVLRLYFNQIQRHADYIENAPTHIKDVFIGPHGQCSHCHNEKEGQCRFRKSYTIGGTFIEKCNGLTFEFYTLSLETLPELLRLFKTFYPHKKRKKSV